MEVVRNFINISGLANTDELPLCVGREQVIQYSETETIYIPLAQPAVKSIFQVLIKVNITSTRTIITHTGKTIVIDGIKKIKIIYTQNDTSSKAIFTNLELPYNTFTEIPINAEPHNISINVLDAYFSLLDERRIYSHLLYMVNVTVGSGESDKPNQILINNSDSDNLSKKNLPLKDKACKAEQILIDLDAEYL